MAGFTALTETMGDEEGVAVAEAFFDGARGLLADHRAREVKTIGDALMIEAAAAADAVRLGLSLGRDVGARHGFPSVRVGMNTGPALNRQDDWFGAAVNLAARVSGAAAGGEVLLTEATRAAAGELADVDFVDHGRHRFRNVVEPVAVFRAVPLGGERDADQLPIDPVCRMAVDPAQRAGVLTYNGLEYSFCSLECVERFAAQPELFVGGE